MTPYDARIGKANRAGFGRHFAVSGMIPRTPKELTETGLIALACALLAGFAGPLGIPGPLPQESWWPAGIALGALIAYGRVLWLGVLAGWFAGMLIAGIDPLGAAALAVVGTGAALVGMLAFQWLRVGPALERMRDVTLMLAVVMPVAALAGAVAGIVPTALAGGPADGLVGALATHWAALLFSNMAFAPLLIGLGLRRPIATTPRRWMEFSIITRARNRPGAGR